MACPPIPAPSQVAEIHRASKDGQLYQVAGCAKSCSAQAEPPEPSEHDILPASQVYSVSSVLASTSSLGPGKAPLPFALSEGTASRPLLAPQPWPWSFSALPAEPLQPHSSSLLSLSPVERHLASPSPTPKVPTKAAKPGPAGECPQGSWWSEPSLSFSQLKPKRVGAGFPKGSCPFRTATELMEKMRTEGQAPWPVQRGQQEPPSQSCSLQEEEGREPVPGLRGGAPKSSAHCGGPSPEKVTKGPSGGPIAKARASKQQQLLAAAAKGSQSIARFFRPRAESPPLPASASGLEGASPSCDGVQGLLAVAPEERTGEEDGALGCLAALPQTKEYTSGGPR